MSDGAAVTPGPGQEAASQRSDHLAEGNQDFPEKEANLELTSAGSSAAAERCDSPMYLPVQTLSKISSHSESLEGCELK